MMLRFIFLSLIRFSFFPWCVTWVSEWSTCFWVVCFPFGSIVTFSLPSVVICFRHHFSYFLTVSLFDHMGTVSGISFWVLFFRFEQCLLVFGTASCGGFSRELLSFFSFLFDMCLLWNFRSLCCRVVSTEWMVFFLCSKRGYCRGHVRDR